MGVAQRGTPPEKSDGLSSTTGSASQTRTAEPGLRSGRTNARPDIIGHGVFLYWIPLGAGGSGFVRFNGRMYEAVKSRAEGRRPLDLYHTALEVRLPPQRFVVETMWPVPDQDGRSRGVVAGGPVFAPWMSTTRVFRYEVRCWENGSLPDADQAVGGARGVSTSAETAADLIDLTHSVPPLTWGRDESGVGDMWNSNSVISWLLTRAGAAIAEIRAPEGGRAPGWQAGISVALGPSRATPRSMASTD